MAKPEESGSRLLGGAQAIVGILNGAWARFEADARAFVAEELAAISQLESGAIRQDLNGVGRRSEELARSKFECPGNARVGDIGLGVSDRSRLKSGTGATANGG